MNYVKSIAKLPVATREQKELFANHVLNVHSWYKHLPLEGSVFTIYLEPDLDREYPSNHPKLPYGNTKEGYQKAFGHLSYQYCIKNYCYQDFCNKIINGKRVAIEKTKIPENYKLQWSFKLFPYCHVEFANVISIFENDIEALENNGYHPQKDLLIKLYKLLARIDDFWFDKLDDEERNFLKTFDYQLEVKEKNKLSKRILSCIKMEKEVLEIENKLRSEEQEKVEKTIDRVVDDLRKIKYELTNKW